MKTIFLNVILLALSLGTAPSVASTNVAISPVHAAWQKSLRDDETLKACLRAMKGQGNSCRFLWKLCPLLTLRWQRESLGDFQP